MVIVMQEMKEKVKDESAIQTPPKRAITACGHLVQNDRCHYKGAVGMKRWVGLGVVADNLINIGRVLEKQARQS